MFLDGAKYYISVIVKLRPDYLSVIIWECSMQVSMHFKQTCDSLSNLSDAHTSLAISLTYCIIIREIT